jgi:hypothetical protein
MFRWTISLIRKGRLLSSVDRMGEVRTEDAREWSKHMWIGPRDAHNIFDRDSSYDLRMGNQGTAPIQQQGEIQEPCIRFALLECWPARPHLSGAVPLFSPMSSRDDERRPRILAPSQRTRRPMSWYTLI